MKTSHQNDLKFHHLGLAVKEPGPAANFLTGIGYKIGAVVRDELQNVNLILCAKRGMPVIEIIYPTEKPGPLVSILKSNVPMIYHICYESGNRERSLRSLEALGNRIVMLSPPQPAILFGGRRVSFYVVAGFGVIEILESR